MDLSPVALSQKTDAEKTNEGKNELSLQAAQPTPSQAPTILTTRPTFTDAWLVIPQGSFQAESGVTYTDFSNRTRGWILPETLLKLGVGKETELRFSVPNYTYLRSDDTGLLSNNFGDTTVGISHHIGIPAKQIDIALIPFLNLPTGANKVSTNSLDPQLRVVVAKTFSPKLVVASQFDTRWNTGQNRTTDVVMNPTLIAYYAFTPKISGFVEYASLVPTQGRSQHYLQYGALYLPTKRQQWDIRLANGLNGASADLTVGFGYSFRVDGLFGDSTAFSRLKKKPKAIQP